MRRVCCDDRLNTFCSYFGVLCEFAEIINCAICVFLESSSTEIQNQTEFIDDSSGVPADILPEKDSLSDLVDDCNGDDEAIFAEKASSDECVEHDVGYDFDIDLHLLRDNKPILDLISINPEDTRPDETNVDVRIHDEMKTSENDVLAVEELNEPKTEVCSVAEESDERTSSLLDSLTELDIYLTNEKSFSKFNFTVGGNTEACNGNSIVIEKDLPPDVNKVTAADQTDELDYISANILSLSSSQSEDASDRLCDSGLTKWQTFSAPSVRLLSVSASRSHVWCTDDRLRIHFACVDGQTPQWNVVEKVSAKQVATSPDGTVIWFLGSDGVAFAASGVSSQHPFGVNLVETAKNVAHIAVDNGEAW